MKSNNDDIATVLALEEPANALLEAIEAAQSALERLCESDYPGADWVSSNIDTDPHSSLGNPGGLADALRMFREAAGDLAAFDYRFYGLADGRHTLGEAAEDIIGMSSEDDANLRRVEGLRQYAASVA